MNDANVVQADAAMAETVVEEAVVAADSIPQPWCSA
jgi:hypothetical protein